LEIILAAIVRKEEGEWNAGD